MLESIIATSMFMFTFGGLFPLITFVVNKMYLQIIYQREALQMLEMIKQKVLQLAYVQVRYGITKIPHIFLMEYNFCTDKLPLAATVHFL